MKFKSTILLLFFLVVPFLSFSQSSAALKRKKIALQREINLLQRNATRAAKNKKLTLGQINSLNTKLRLMQSKMEVIDSEMRNLDQQIHTNTNAVKSLKDQLILMKKSYASMIQFAQKNQNGYEKMMFIFSARDFNQAYKRIKYLQQFGQYRKKQADYIEGTQKDIGYKLVVLDKNLKEKTTLLQEQEAEKKKLAQTKTQQSKVLTRYTRQEKKYRQDIAVRRVRQRKLNADIRAAIARDIALARKRALAASRTAAANGKARPGTAKKKTYTALKATPETARLSAAFEQNRGKLPWPVSTGTITERFGKHMQDQASYTNDGVNIETAAGATVRAVFKGTVSIVNNQFGRYMVLIKHGGYYTVYSNLRSVSVARGSRVTTKQPIGIVASSDGRPELQFQIRRGVTPQNPSAWIAK